MLVPNFILKQNAKETNLNKLKEKEKLPNNSNRKIIYNYSPDFSQMLYQDSYSITRYPDLYVHQNPLPNAYALAISGKKPFIVVHTSLVELLNRRELQVFTHTLSCSDASDPCHLTQTASFNIDD